MINIIYHVLLKVSLSMTEYSGTHGIFDRKLKANKWHAACSHVAKTLGLIMVEDAKMISIYNFNVEQNEDGTFTNKPLLECVQMLKNLGVKASSIKKISTEPHINIKYKDCGGSRKKFFR